MSKALKKLIDINGLREFKNKLVGTDSAYVQTGAVDQTVAGTKTFSKPIAGSVTGSSGSCTGNAASATKAIKDSDGNQINTTYSKNGHTHDDRYYTESEVNNLLGGKANTSGRYDTLNVGYADTAGNGVDSGGIDWIRFKNGIQICWKSVRTYGIAGSRWTYGASFSSNPVVTVCDQGGDTKTVYLTRAANIRTTSCYIVMVDVSGGSYREGEAQCIAIGSWK